MQITEAELSIIKSIISRYLPNAKIILFGSRAKGKAKSYSDADIAIITEEGVSLEIMAEMRADFEESNLSYRVDIVDWMLISPEFREIITRTGASLQ